MLSVKKIRKGLTASTTIRPFLRFRLWFVPLLIAVLVVLGWWMRSTMDQSVKNRLEESLETILATNVTALQIWLDGQKSVTSLLAESRRVRHAAKLMNDSKQLPVLSGELREFLEPFTRGRGYAGFVLTDRRGRSVGVLGPAAIQLETLGDHAALVARTYMGETVVSHPFAAKLPVPDENGVLQEGRALMFVSAPVRDVDGNVVAALSLLIRPEDDFMRIPLAARVEESGETYLFNAQGLMISDSRFNDQLREIGLIPDDAESSAFLTIQIRDPGGNLLDGHAAGSGLPLTRMAGAAVTGQDGVDVDGYRDYRGVQVIGAWTWLPEYGFGVATELDYDEAMKMPGQLNRIFWAVIGVLALASAAILLGTVIISRMGTRMSTAVAEARRLGQYTLDRKLGEGGMGEVFRASHAMLRRPTAIKLLHRDRAGPEDLARFEREVQITSRLTHPNTIAIYDYGRTPEGVFYYAMEYLPGIDLARLVEIDGHQPATRVIHILTQVCGSLDEAHGAGLIHRDVKPENVILCERGGRHDVAKVLDFGIVKDMGSGGAQLTATGTFTGTPLYLSPETVRSPETVNARSDIYAVGAVGYFLLVGQPPFDGESVVDICHKHVHETPVPPSQRVDGGIDTDLEHVILSCLAKDPGLRPTTAGHLADLLLKCAAGGKWSEDDARAWWAEHAEAVGQSDDDSPALRTSKPKATVVLGPGKNTAPGQTTIVE